jgi:hypothetical protein
MSGYAPDFDWNLDDIIVVPGQQAIACYLNPKGAVVIRQEGQYGIDEDVWVVVAPAHVPTLCRELMALIGAEKPLDMTEVDELVAAAESKDRTTSPMTAAERAKRYRGNKRHGESVTQRDENVTRRDGARDEFHLVNGASNG